MSRSLLAHQLALRSPLAPHRAFCSASRRWRVAVVGSGPSGFYAADFLLKKDASVTVSMFERLPVPFGLVRYGVAPDHQEVKNVMERFEFIAADDRFTFFGNVSVGRPSPAAGGAMGDGWADQLRQGLIDFGTSLGGSGMAAGPRIELEDLRRAYDAVILAYGASDDRKLGIEGECLPGVHPAREFVDWYNGHPEWAKGRRDSAAGGAFDLSAVETAVIIGTGNVALDCARILTKDPDAFASDSDICERALEELRSSALRQVVILGRRGVLQAAFTIKELRELTKLDGVDTIIDTPADAFSSAVLKAAAADRPRKRLVELMQTLVPANDASGGTGGKQIKICLQRSPVCFQADDGGRLASVLVEHTKLVGEPGPNQRAEAVAESAYTLPCQLALTSVGYRSLPIDGAPFDERRAIVPNSKGRVDGEPGLYTVGWLKRGPSGIILTNVNDAAETVDTLLQDRKVQTASGVEGAEKGGDDEIRDILDAHGGVVLDFAAVRRIAEAEVRRGEGIGKVREKFVSVQELLEAAR